MLQLDDGNQRFLLRLARETIHAALEARDLPRTAPASPPLLEPAGAFVTLKKDGRLRGCIGHVRAEKPVYRTVRECAISAAFHDPRFEPVTARELPLLHLEISVLSPLYIISPSQIEVGRHGLMVSMGSRRGLLLPQVPVEWKWDRIHFLEETCLKAGLSRDDWQRGASIEAFTAQVFAEPLPELASTSASLER